MYKEVGPIRKIKLSLYRLVSIWKLTATAIMPNCMRNEGFVKMHLLNNIKLSVYTYI